MNPQITQIPQKGLNQLTTPASKPGSHFEEFLHRLNFLSFLSV
jgi:UDP-N-acetylglucosamine pyrophosphorylase